MLTLLFCIAAPHQLVARLTAVDFRDMVVKRSAGEVWGVLFIGGISDSDRACALSLAAVEAVAAERSAAHFGVVNVTEEPFLQRYLRIGSVPRLRVFHSGGSDDMRGEITARAVAEFVGDRIPHFVRLFSRSWAHDPVPSAVLFTEHVKVPLLWGSLSAEFADSGIRFGICNEFHIHQQLSISRLPTVVFYNRSKQVHYHGAMDTAALRDALSAFLNGTLSDNDAFDDDGFYRMQEFDDQCRGREFCVLYTGGGLSEEYRRTRLVNKKQAIKFFYGKGDYPFPQMREDTYYIWNPRRKGLIVVPHGESLDSSIDRIINGGAKWIKPNEL